MAPGVRGKSDPAWNHCETITNGGKVQIKCKYCGKIFKGGGIYRVKEHLAGQKGNGKTCLHVKPDVKRQMLDSLNGGKKSKQQNLLLENSGCGSGGTNTTEGSDDVYGLDAGNDLFSVREILEHDSDANTCRDNSVNNKSSSRKRKERVRNAIDVVPLAMEPVSISGAKRDPAWKHCQMFKNGDKVQLKCIYCGKFFKGGGIYRIKEHLAGQKGNGVPCLRVQPDVRRQMLESLNGISGGKGKMQKLLKEMPGYNNTEVSKDHGALIAEIDLFSANGTFEHEWSLNDTPGERRNKQKLLEKSGYDNPVTTGVEGLNNRSNLNVELDLLPVNEITRHCSYVDKSKRDEALMKDHDESEAIHVTSSQATKLKKVNTEVHMAIGRFFFDVGIHVDAVNSPYFQPMIDTIALQGQGAVGPSDHELRSWILKKSVEEVRNDVNQCRGAWIKSGCSILVHECNSRNGKVFVNFLVYCPQGTIFLRSADISNDISSSDALYELIRETVEEVGVRSVLQVVTSSEDRYVIAGKKLMDTYPTIFWTPCAGRCIDLMLEDIGKLSWVKSIIDQAKAISRYIYSSNIVLNMMRRYTSGADLVVMGITRTSSDFMTLKQIVDLRRDLHLMVSSEEWMGSPYSKSPEGFTLLDYINDESFWSSCALITRLTDPLLRLMRIVGSGKIPAMGFVYAALYRVKEKIKKELVNKKEYLDYWNIIDHRWEQLQWHPLHAAGFYFNPKFFYSLEGDALYHIRSLVYDCIEKLVPEPEIQDKIMKETASYQGGHGDFGRKIAIRARDTLLPTEWWLAYGGGCPNLTRLAIRILSQSCSLIQYKFNKIPLEPMHDWKNCLEHQRLGDLAFIQFNMSLKQIVLGDKQQLTVDPISYENVNLVGDWVMEKEVCPQLQTADWTAVDPPLGNVKLLDAEDDIKALGAGFDDYDILNGVKGNEEINASFL